MAESIKIEDSNSAKKVDVWCPSIDKKKYLSNKPRDSQIEKEKSSYQGFKLFLRLFCGGGEDDSGEITYQTGPKQTQRKHFGPKLGLAINPHLTLKSSSLKIAFLYNDQKLNTKDVLQKLEVDTVSNLHSLEMALLERGGITPKINQPDIIFLFYFISNAREHFEEIQANISTISTSFPKVPIHLLLLKDENCHHWPLDKSKIQTLRVTCDYFMIYSLKYAEFTLFPEDFTKPNRKHKPAEVKLNYDDLCKTVQLWINSRCSNVAF